MSPCHADRCARTARGRLRRSAGDCEFRCSAATKNLVSRGAGVSLNAPRNPLLPPPLVKLTLPGLTDSQGDFARPGRRIFLPGGYAGRGGQRGETYAAQAVVRRPSIRPSFPFERSHPWTVRAISPSKRARRHSIEPCQRRAAGRENVAACRPFFSLGSNIFLIFFLSPKLTHHARPIRITTSFEAIETGVPWCTNSMIGGSVPPGGLSSTA